MKITQTNFWKIKRQQETLQRDMEASFENLVIQLGLVSSQLTFKLRSNGDFSGNNLYSPRYKEIE